MEPFRKLPKSLFLNTKYFLSASVSEHRRYICKELNTQAYTSEENSVANPAGFSAAFHNFKLNHLLFPN